MVKVSDLISRKAVDQQKELATDNNVVTKSGKDNNAKDADYECIRLGRTT